MSPFEPSILAPKPIRLSSSSNPFARQRTPATSRIVSAPTDAFSRIKLSDDADSSTSTEDEDDEVEDSNRPYSLAPEALEEFLAILRPALRSPSARTRRHHSASSFPRSASSAAGMTSPGYERPHPYKRDSLPSSSTVTKTKSGPSSVSSLSSDTAVPLLDPTTVTERDNRNQKKKQATSSLNGGGGESQMLGVGGSEDQWRSTGSNSNSYYASLLASPISRSQTRNPLPRHPSYETLSSSLVFHFQRSPELNSRSTPDQLILATETSSPLPPPMPDATTANHENTPTPMETC